MRLVVLVLVGIVLFAFLAHPSIQNRVPIEFDLGRYHLPLRDFYQKCLINGDDPHWCPHLFCGYDLHGEGQVGMEHPWHRLLYSTLPLTVAFNLEVFANYLLMCLGMYLFLRRHALSRQAALSGALVLTFGGYALPHYSHTNAIAIIAHIPWLLWLTDVFWFEHRKSRALAGAMIALTTGSEILLGYPQYVYFSSLAEGVYVVFLLIHRDRRFTSLLWWVVFKLLGVAIGCPQLLPSLVALNRSPRLGYDRDFAGMLSLPPEMFMQLVSPTSFNVGTQLHEFTVYGGSLATLATVYLLTKQRGHWRRLDWFALALIVVAVPLALGNFTPLFDIYKRLPIVGVFRGPCRYLVLGHFAAAILVARMFQEFEDGAPIRSYLFLVVPILAWIVALMPLQQWIPESRQKFLTVGASWIGATSLTIASCLVSCAQRGKRWAVPLLLVVGFSDLAYWGFRTIYGTHDQPVHTFVDLHTFLESQVTPPGPPNGRVQIEDIHGNALIMKGWSLTSGYVGLSPPRAADYTQDETLRFVGTMWKYGGEKWQELAGLPRIRWEEHVDHLTVVTDRPGHVEITTDAEEHRKLILAESRHPSWIATIDGRQVAILTAHVDFQYITVPPGDHRVLFRFDPVHRTLGRALAACGLALTVALSIWIARRPRSTMSESSA